jgi:hypothetical protein
MRRTLAAPWLDTYRAKTLSRENVFERRCYGLSALQRREQLIRPLGHHHVAGAR